MVRTLAAVALSFLVGGAAAAQAPSPASTVHYSCAKGKSLIAEYFEGTTRTAPDGRPVPGGRVVLTFPDGKKISLAQTLSGSGIRYANEAETLVFWSKGDTAFVEEGPKQTVTYENCVGKK